MSDSQPWSARIAPYFAQLEGIAPSTAFDDVTPRLSNGPHWGIIEGFNSDPPSTFDQTATTTGLLSEAAASGASITRVQMDWSELETAPGVYDQAALDSVFVRLAATEQAGFVTLSTLDSEGPTLPSHFMNEETGGLRDGLLLNAPEVQIAFERFLDWLVPQLSAAGVWGIAIGNEVELPVEDRFVTEEGAALFFERGISHVKGLDPDMAVGVTLTSDASNIAPNLTQRIAEAADIFVVNFYGDTGLALPTPEDWDRRLDNIRDMAAGKPVFFQELGMPVGYEAAGLPGESTLQSSLAPQTEFFAFMGQEIGHDPQLIGATVFQLYDWSPELLASYVGALEDPILDYLAEALGTIGLVSWSDGEVRPAWSTWLEALDSAAAIRDFAAMPVVLGDDTADFLDVDGSVGQVVYAGAGRDTVLSSTANDALDLGAGSDFALSFGGDDVILGRGGKDTVYAGSGDDWVSGGAGADRIKGENGDDHLEGGRGADKLSGGMGNDSLLGDGGADTIRADLGDDWIFGGDGKDRLFGNAGNDWVEGGHGADRLAGGAGNDTLLGGHGDDTLFAGPGADVLNGQEGDDLLIAGAGADSFVFEEGGGHDTILGFDTSADHIFIDAALVGSIATGADIISDFAITVCGQVTLDLGEVQLTFASPVDMTAFAEAIWVF